MKVFRKEGHSLSSLGTISIIGYISENAILMKFFVILPDIPYVLQPALIVMTNN